MRNSKSRKTHTEEPKPTDILLREYNFNLRQEVELEMQRDTNVLDRINTMGAVTEDDRASLERNCLISVTHLEDLLDPCLHLCHLIPSIKQALGVSGINPSSSVKVVEVLRVLRNGVFYRFLADSLPKCIINNRTTSANVEIVIASVIAYSVKKLTMELIKEALQIFSLQEKQNQIQGVFLEPPIIMALLKHINKTISHQSLKNWMNKNKFEIPNFLMPYEFLYLVCQCHNRDVYLRKVQKLNLKYTEESKDGAHHFMPAKEMLSTLDNRIQMQLLQMQSAIEFKPAKHQPIYKYAMPSSKKTKSFSRFRQLLRDETMYRNIKQCLVSKKKTETIKECLAEIQPVKLKLSRPYSSVAPIVSDLSVMNNSFLTTIEEKKKPKDGVYRQLVKKRPTSSLGTNNKAFKRLYQRELSAFDLNKLQAHDLLVTDMLL